MWLIIASRVRGVMWARIAAVTSDPFVIGNGIPTRTTLAPDRPATKSSEFRQAL